ncbi:MAG: hypothetical protein ACHQIL_08355 [Steroidobacterales bacterium]
MRGWLVCVVLMALPALSGAHADGDKLRAWKVAAVAVLSARGDANSIATAAMLSPAGGPELAARASELAPESAPLAWVRLRLCATTPACDFRDAATAMRWLDPDNPAAWLPTLGAAQKERDSVEVERILYDMSQGKHIDVYAIPVAVLMFDELKAVAASLPRSFAENDASRLALVIGIANARLIPSFATVDEVCRESAAATERREACLKIARKMQRGDTVNGELAGLAVEKHTLPPDSKEAHALSDRRHVLEWQTAAAAHFDTPLLPWVRNSHARWHLARMRALHREQDVVVAILREQGTPLSPPEPPGPPSGPSPR